MMLAKGSGLSTEHHSFGVYGHHLGTPRFRMLWKWFWIVAVYNLMLVLCMLSAMILKSQKYHRLA